MSDAKGSRGRLWRFADTATVVDGTAIVLLEGRLGHTGADELETMARGLVDQGVVDLAIDLAEVDYISSAALRVFEALGTRLAGRGGRLTLRNPSVPARLALELAGLLAAEPGGPKNRVNRATG